MEPIIPTVVDKITARIAGALYLGLVITGIFYLRYVPSKLIDSNDAAATFNNIVENEKLFRFGILAGLIGQTIFLILPLVLARLLHRVNKTYAVLMVALAVVSVPVSLVNLLNYFTVLNLVSGKNYLTMFQPQELQQQVLFYLDSYSSGNQLVSLFWGLWLFPFGYLVFKSGFIPKILGVLLMIGCLGYVVNFLGNLLMTDYRSTGISSITRLASIGELAICLWLLIVGVRRPH